MQPQTTSDLLSIIKDLQNRMDTAEKALVNDVVQIGDVTIWPAANTFLPFNYVPADGRALDRIGYAALFAEYGTTYGIGDGSSTFNVPNYTTLSLEQELSYVEFTSNVTVTATTEAAATTVVTGSALTANGTDAYWIEFFTPLAEPGVNGDCVIEIYLFDGSTSLGIIGQVLNSGAGSFPLSVPVVCKRKIIPSAASHTYSIRASQAVANGTIFAGTGGTGNFLPGYIRITPDPGNVSNTLNFVIKVL